jgi:hypothetical protein
MGNTTNLRLSRVQYNFLSKITTLHKNWFLSNFGELTMIQVNLIMEVAFYTNLDKNLLNIIRERYITDLQQKKV